MPKQTRQDLEKELESTKRQADLLAACLSELIRRPKDIVWISKGAGETMVKWGLIRLNSACGGYVIRYVGSINVSPHYLEDLTREAYNRFVTRPLNDKAYCTLYENEEWVSEQAKILANKARTEGV
jgi:hypothetical protein